jgi:PAS domain S-box-containing protein
MVATGAVFFNFLTAVVLGYFSSVQRNRYLLDLVELETKQNIILSTMKEGVVLHLASGGIVSSNESALKILGLTEREISGKTITDPQWKTFYPDDTVCPPEMHPSSVALETGKPVEKVLIKLQRADGSISWLSVSAIPTFELGGETPVAVVVTLLDVTDQKEKEDKIRAQEVSLMLASRLTGLGEMAAGIAHEINNPLAIISGRVGLIQDSLSNSEVDLEFVKNNVQTIENTVTRIVKIVSSMKSLSRHTPNDNFVKSSINAIIEDVVEISRQRIRTCEIDLQIEQAEDFLFDCYPGQISQVILNLMNNSIDAIEKFESKWIRLSVSKDDSFVF